MCAPKSSPYSKSNSFWPLFSTGIASRIPLVLRLLGNLRRAAELLVDQGAGHRWIGAAVERRLEALEDQVLAVGDPLDLLGSRIALDPEALDERPAVVECQDVQLAVVRPAHIRPKASHRRSSPACPSPVQVSSSPAAVRDDDIEQRDRDQ